MPCRMTGPIRGRDDLDHSHHRHLDAPALPTASQTIDTPPSPAAAIPPRRGLVSAPPELGRKHPKIEYSTPQPRPATLDPKLLPPGGAIRNSFGNNSLADAAVGSHLDPQALVRAIQNLPNQVSSNYFVSSLADAVSGPASVSVFDLRQDGTYSNLRAPGTVVVTKEEEIVSGVPFKIEWICLGRLSFRQIRHFRNAWNHNLEIKVSRDGTELDPDVGQRLLEEWGRLATPS